jgi:hypothetical protein
VLGAKSYHRPWGRRWTMGTSVNLRVGWSRVGVLVAPPAHPIPSRSSPDLGEPGPTAHLGTGVRGACIAPLLGDAPCCKNQGGGRADASGKCGQ